MLPRTLKQLSVTFLSCAALVLALVPAYLTPARTRAAAAEVAPVSIGPIQGTFYPNPTNSGPFDPSQLSTSLFSQQFRVLDFNPPQSAQVTCSNATGVNEFTRPFTDVVPEADGTCSKVVAEGNGIQAGFGDHTAFQAVFTADLTVAEAGQVTFNFYSDDGWILAMGHQVNGSAQPTYLSGSMLNPPPSGITTQYPVVGAYNTASSPAQNTVTVNFPSGGTYPMEVDYTECCLGQEALVLGTSFGNPIPPSPAEADLSVAISSPQGTTELGQSRSYTVEAKNNGPADATAVTVTDQLPASLEFVDSDPSEKCPAGSPVSCTITIGSLASGASTKVTIDVKVVKAGDATNTVSVAGGQLDPNPANDTATLHNAVTIKLCRGSGESWCSNKTQVEPHVFSYGSTIVSAFQVGRYKKDDPDGGAEAIGWATSTNGGATWKSGLLPGITAFSNPDKEKNLYDRVSDPSVAYDAAAGTWMIASLGITMINGTPIGTAVLVSRSKDGGSTWTKPAKVVGAGPYNRLDKPWIVCDNNPKETSKYRGNCYVQLDDLGRNGAEYSGGAIYMSTLTKDEKEWKLKPIWQNSRTGNPARGLGGQPLVQPNGTVVVPFLQCTNWPSCEQIGVFTSHDGGEDWSTPRAIASFTQAHSPSQFRFVRIPSAAMDGAGKVYVAWADCEAADCKVNDIFLSTSSDDADWSDPQNVTPEPGVDHFIPVIAVDTSTSGSTAHVALTYYYYPAATCTEANCQLDVGFISSIEGGAPKSWSGGRQIAGPMSLSWLVNTDQGYMVGDYTGVFFSSGRAYPVFTIANKPGDDTLLDEAIYTVAGGLSMDAGG